MAVVRTLDGLSNRTGVQALPTVGWVAWPTVGWVASTPRDSKHCYGVGWVAATGQ